LIGLSRDKGKEGKIGKIGKTYMERTSWGCKVLGTLSLGHKYKCYYFIIGKGCPLSHLPARALARTEDKREDPASQAPQPHPMRIDGGRRTASVRLVLGIGGP
jgi:hypothetical protein